MLSSTLRRRPRPVSATVFKSVTVDNAIEEFCDTFPTSMQQRWQRQMLSSSASSSSATQNHNKHFSSTVSTTTVLPPPSPSSDENITVAPSKSTTATTTSTTTTKAYLELAKAKLSALVVTTTAAGFVAAGGPMDVQVLSSCLVGTALCSSSAAAWNQIIEIPRDAQMKRTQTRPLVQGDLTKRQAQVAATAWGVGGTALLAVGTDPVTAVLGASNVALYAGLYTWMKPRSMYNTWVGAVVGAIPPVMGYTAATAGAGLLDVDCLLLGTTLYLWQLPHFFALSYMHRVDYARGGFQMLPLVDEERTSQVILKYAAYLSAVPLVSTALNVTSSMFALEGVALNSYALYVAYKFHQDRTNANARKIFLTSLWYLPSWLVLFLLHSKVWDKDDEETKDVLQEAMQHAVHAARNVGRKACLHEQAIVQRQNTNSNNNENGGSQDTAGNCPIVLSKRGGAELQSKAADAVVAMENGATVATVKAVVDAEKA